MAAVTEVEIQKAASSNSTPKHSPPSTPEKGEKEKDQEGKQSKKHHVTIEAEVTTINCSSEEDMSHKHRQVAGMGIEMASNSKSSQAASSSRRILIAVDGSENSEAAFDWYINNMRHNSRDFLVLLNVSATGLAGMPIHAGVDISQQNFDALNDARRSSTSQVLADVVELYEDKAKDAGLSDYEFVHIQDSNPGKAICKYAKHNNIDHVIMGTRGYSKIKRKLLGSVSDYVINNCTASATIIRSKPEK